MYFFLKKNFHSISNMIFQMILLMFKMFLNSKNSIKGKYELFSSFDKFCILLRNTNGTYKRISLQQSLLVFYNLFRNTLNHIHRLHSMCYYIAFHAFLRFQVADFSHKIQATVQNTQDLLMLEAYDPDCMASRKTYI